MTKKTPLFILTTYNDLSLPFFFAEKILNNYQVTAALWQAPSEQIIESLQQLTRHHPAPVIYLRDPFNAQLSLDHITNHARTIFAWLAEHPAFKVIDSLTSLDDLMLEDKWLQAQKWSTFLPPTTLVAADEEVDFTTYFVKKRLSSRSQGVVFTTAQFQGQRTEYIKQPQLKIRTEYRVIGVREQILPLLGIKQSKTATTKIKVIGTQSATDQLLVAVKKIHATVPYDLVGYDFAELESGQYQLIEINRSPQIAAYYQQTQINVAELLLT